MAVVGRTSTSELSPDYVEALARFKKAEEWYQSCMNRQEGDLKFAFGDPDNQYQWDASVLRARKNRPCLTVNMVRQHNLEIINSIRKSRPRIKVRATGGPASYESASAYQALVSYVERCSNADLSYHGAVTRQIHAGMGAWRVTTDYADEMTFDQIMKIEPIHDPSMVYFDPDARSPDRRDGRFTFLFEDMSHDKCEEKHARYKEKGAFEQFRGAGIGGDAWLGKDHVRVCEYWRKKVKHLRLFAKKMENGEEGFIREDQMEQELINYMVQNKARMRKVPVVTVERIVMIGRKIVSKDDWPGKFIPIVPLIGEEMVVDKKLDIRGHTRNLKDAQRMYNYWSSSSVEYGALQTKTPWIIAQEALEDFDEVWRTANIKNHAYLPYHSVDEHGNQVPPPQRVEPPVSSPVAMGGMDRAQMEMMRASGQFGTMFGEAGNERTGEAIGKRLEQGENSTYHFIDNLGTSIRYTGEIILDLFPKIFDTKRVLMVQAEDATYYQLTVDPKAAEAFQKRMNHKQEVVNRIFNPNVGKYEVEIDVRPGYATRREEAFNAYTLLLTQSPELAGILGDLLFLAADFENAEEAAARMRRMIPQQALGEGPSPQEQQLLQENQNMRQLLERSISELMKAQMSERAAKTDRQVDMYKALTERLEVVLSDIQKRQITEQEAQRLVVDTISDVMKMDIEKEKIQAQSELPLQGGGARSNG